MLAPLSRMLNVENDDFVGRIINDIVDQIVVSRRYKLSNALGSLKTAGVWEEQR
jgi:hypothetical protein